jgi:ATP-dependent DNA ligase
MPPVAPMLAKSIESLPEGEGMVFEPKWDGFRCIVFRDGDEIILGSRNERPLTRYFPELVERLLQVLPPRCVVDGEIVVAGPDGLDFDALQQRIHPAESRVKRLSEETPSSFVAFDLLALDDRDLTAEPLTERRALLAAALTPGDPIVHLTPATTDRSPAADWFVRFEGAGLDGVMAKPPGGMYEPNKRVQFKVKHKRTADCVVAGFRMHKDGDGVGSLLLGLYDDDGQLHHVGVASSFTARRRKELLAELAPHLQDALDEHPWREWAEAEARASDTGGPKRMPGATSRWNAKKDLSWTPLRIELVAEVAYEQVQNGRFRHSARLLHWRPDREPASCTYAQLEVVPAFELAEIFST